MENNKLAKYTPYYNKEALLGKIMASARLAGRKVVYYVLLLYYVLQSSSTKMADKAKIIGALGYFIFPADLIPDIMPVVGYTDDLAALAWCVYSVAKNLTPEIKEKAAAKARQLFEKGSGMRGSNS
ncbi:MAG: DUF1232 domain-containing protein [Bacteroidales bacterium]|nr:DUF1232 domain-containing protein [Bacteroidales bacterium]